MDPSEKLAQRYHQDIQEFGDSSHAVHWKSPATQRSRFDVLTQMADLQNASILDVGCGKGDLLAYLKTRGFAGSYTGYDFAPGMVEYTRRRFPETIVEQVDVLEPLPARCADYAIICGTLHDRWPGEFATVQDIVQRVYERCLKGLAVTLMSSYVDYRDKELLYVAPEDAFRFGKSLTRFVTLRHDYARFEYSLYLYREATGPCS